MKELSHNTQIKNKAKKNNKNKTNEKVVDPNPNNIPWCFHSMTTNNGSLGAIVTDLDYIHQTYTSTDSCDLWEVYFFFFFAFFFPFFFFLQPRRSM